jgi:hypothetical protein
MLINNIEKYKDLFINNKLPKKLHDNNIVIHLRK